MKFQRQFEDYEAFAQHMLQLLRSLPDFMENADPKKWDHLDLDGVILKNVSLGGISGLRIAREISNITIDDKVIFIQAPLIADYLILDCTWEYQDHSGSLAMHFAAYTTSFNISYDGSRSSAHDIAGSGYLGPWNLQKITGVTIPGINESIEAHVSRMHGEAIAGYVEKLHSKVGDFLRDCANKVLNDLDIATYILPFTGVKYIE